MTKIVFLISEEGLDFSINNAEIVICLEGKKVSFHLMLQLQKKNKNKCIKDVYIKKNDMKLEKKPKNNNSITLRIRKLFLEKRHTSDSRKENTNNSTGISI